MIGHKLRVGILGIGFGANGHIPAYQATPGMEIMALGFMDSEVERGKQIAKQFNIPLTFTDLEQLAVSPEVDMVSVVVPPFLHYPLTLKALKAGKHVLCEKPMALNMTEAREMLRLSQEAKRIAMLNFEFRFLPSRRKMKALIDDGYLGDLYSVNLTMFFDYNANPITKPWNWLSLRERGGGILGAIGSHYIDLLLWMFGDIVEVCSRFNTFVKSRYPLGSKEAKKVETEDSFCFFCQFLNGANGVIHFCSVADQGIGIRSGVGLAKIEAYGSEGTLILDPEDKLWGAQHGKKELEEIPIDRPPYEEGVSIFLQRQRRCIQELATEWIYGIESEKQRTPSFADGLRCQEMMDAIRMSNEKSSWISLPLGNRKS